MQVCLIHPSIPTAPHALCRRAPRSESREGSPLGPKALALQSTVKMVAGEAGVSVGNVSGIRSFK